MQVQVHDNLDEEVVLGLLEQFLDDGKISIRKLELNRSKNRGGNNLLIEKEEPYSDAFLSDLRYLVQFYRNCSFYKINEKYLDRINTIGIDNIISFIITHKCDDKTREFLDDVYSSSYDIHTGNFEGAGTAIGGNDKRLIKVDEHPTMYRFYFNMPKTSYSVDFINEYIKLCQKNGISYRMKPFKNLSRGSRDVTIIYSSAEDFEIKKSILFKLYEDYKDKIEFGSPPEACARIDGTFIGICHNGAIYSSKMGPQFHGTYNNYIDILFSDALIYSFKQYLLSSSFIKDTTKETIRSFDYSLSSDELSDVIPGKFLYYNINGKDDIRKVIGDYFFNSSELKKIYSKSIFEYMKKIHNIINGFDINENTSIALDTWYTRDPLLFEKIIGGNVGKSR